MRKLLARLAALLLCLSAANANLIQKGGTGGGGGGGTFARVGTFQTNSDGSGSAITSIAAPNINAVSGNLIVASCFGVGFETHTVTDSAGNTFISANDQTQNALSWHISVFFAAVTNASATDAVTCHFSGGGSTFPDVGVMQYSGQGASPLDQIASGQPTGTATGSTGSFTTTSANAAVFCHALTDGASTYSAGSGYTLQSVNTSSRIFEDRLLTATGTFSGSASASTAGNWLLVCASFK